MFDPRMLVVLLVLLAGGLTTVSQQAESRSQGEPPRQDLSTLAERAILEGDRLFAEWSRDSLQMAAKKYAEARSLWHTSGQTRREAEALKKVGNTYAILSNYQGAIDSYNQALGLTANSADQRFEVQILTDLADAYLDMANVKKAFPLCSQAQEISNRIGYAEGMASTLNCLGVVNSISNDVLPAQQNFENALQKWQGTKSELGLASTNLNLGYLHSNLGNMQLALNYYQRALIVWRSNNERQKQALTLTAMGGVYVFEGEKQKALDLHSQALKIFQTIGNRTGEAVTLNGIGYLYDDLGQPAEALKSYTRALELFKSIGNSHYAAITLGYLGRVHSALGDKARAVEYYDEKLATSRAVGDQRMESYTLRDIGNVLSAANEKERALDFYRQALGLSREVLDRRGEAYIVLSIGSIYEQDLKTQALSYYQKALALMQAVADRRGEVLALYSIARAERDLGRLVDARRDIERSLELIEQLRMKVFSPSLRISYLTTVYKHYEFYVNLLMQLNRHEPRSGYEILAFEVNDHARARTLLENLRAARTDIRKDVDPVLLAQESELQQRLNQKAEQQARLLAGKFLPEQAAAIKKEVETLLNQFQEVESRVRHRSPKYAALTQPQRLKLSDIQKQLDPDTLLLEYSLGDECSYGWAVTPTSITSFELPKKQEIEVVAQQLYKAIIISSARRKHETRLEQKARITKAASDYSTLSAKLGGILLDPVAPLLNGKRLLIVADGVLQYIPFSALPEPGGMNAEVGAAPPIVLQHEVIMLPSLSTLAALRDEVRGRVAARKTIAVFADPVFQPDDPRFRTTQREVSSKSRFSRTRVGARLSEAEDVGPESDVSDEAVIFDRLPFSLQEAQAIFQIVPRNETKRALGFDANLTTALDPELRQYRVIHFATHALLDNSHPELSGVVLSLLDRSGKLRDGFLRLNEIYNLDLPGELVVLSACQTALGKQARGEGLIGLTRGFMYAGVPRVIATLWRINDRAAAELMRHFYEAMFRQRLAPAAALRAAQIAMWKSNELRFPHDWAAFVLQGEWK
jgi:CHAT domain-containing protein/predicted negative regulator of RcsB-dependent stress response